MALLGSDTRAAGQAEPGYGTAVETAAQGQGRCGFDRGGSAGAGHEQGRLCWGSRLARAWLWKLGGEGFCNYDRK